MVSSQAVRYSVAPDSLASYNHVRAHTDSRALIAAHLVAIKDAIPAEELTPAFNITSHVMDKCVTLNNTPPLLRIPWVDAWQLPQLQLAVERITKFAPSAVYPDRNSELNLCDIAHLQRLSSNLRSVLHVRMWRCNLCLTSVRSILLVLPPGYVDSVSLLDRDGIGRYPWGNADLFIVEWNPEWNMANAGAAQTIYAAFSSIFQASVDRLQIFDGVTIMLDYTFFAPVIPAVGAGTNLPSGCPAANDVLAFLRGAHI
jgi:hypothetical protein